MKMRYGALIGNTVEEANQIAKAVTRFLGATSTANVEVSELSNPAGAVTLNLQVEVTSPQDVIVRAAQNFVCEESKFIRTLYMVLV